MTRSVDYADFADSRKISLITQNSGGLEKRKQL